MPCGTRYDCRYGEEKVSPLSGNDITRASPGRSSRKVLAGNLRRAARAHILQIVVEESLNAPVRGTQQIPEHQIFLVIVAKQRARDLQKIGVGMAAWGMAQRGQLQIDVAHDLGFRRNALGFSFWWCYGKMAGCWVCHSESYHGVTKDLRNDLAIIWDQQILMLGQGDPVVIPSRPRRNPELGAAGLVGEPVAVWPLASCVAIAGGTAWDSTSRRPVRA